MKKILSCAFNMDTGCVELRFSDGSMISIDTTAVENEVARRQAKKHRLCTARPYLEGAAG